MHPRQSLDKTTYIVGIVPQGTVPFRAMLWYRVVSEILLGAIRGYFIEHDLPSHPIRPNARRTLRNIP